MIFLKYGKLIWKMELIIATTPTTEGTSGKLERAFDLKLHNTCYYFRLIISKENAVHLLMHVFINSLMCLNFCSGSISGEMAVCQELWTPRRIARHSYYPEEVHMQ